LGAAHVLHYLIQQGGLAKMSSCSASPHPKGSRSRQNNSTNSRIVVCTLIRPVLPLNAASRQQITTK
jgi:hypothetical protein